MMTALSTREEPSLFSALSLTHSSRARNTFGRFSSYYHQSVLSDLHTLPKKAIGDLLYLIISTASWIHTVFAASNISALRCIQSIPEFSTSLHDTCFETL
jgi:hypothetical protein